VWVGCWSSYYYTKGPCCKGTPEGVQQHSRKMSRLFGQPDGLLVIISKPPYEKEKLSVLCISYFKLYAMKKFQFSSQLTFYFPFSFPARHAISILHFIISTLLHFWGDISIFFQLEHSQKFETVQLPHQTLGI
jgi:hypothetical protein